MSNGDRSSRGAAFGALQEHAGGASDVAALYRAHFPALCAVLRRRFGAGPPDPEDAAQAAFAQYANLADRAEVANPKAFIYRCAHNYVIDQRRRQAVASRAAAEVVALNFGAPAGDDPARVLESRDDLAAVAAAVQALDPRRRDVLILHSIDGLSCAEIARRMNLSPTRVIQLYAQAVAACAKALRAQSGEDSA